MLTRKASMGGSAYLFGRTERPGRDTWNIPFIGPMPREVVGLLGYAVSMNTDGALSDMAEGLGDASLTLVAYKVGKRGAVSSSGVGAGSSRVAELEAQLQDELDDLVAGMSDYDDDVDYVETSGLEDFDEGGDALMVEAVEGEAADGM